MFKHLYFVVFFFFNCKEFKNDANQKPEEKLGFVSQHKKFNFLPTSTTKVVYEHKGYTFSYSEAHEQSEWVAYVLENTQNRHRDFDRPYFEQDPIVETGSADWRNYKKSGYTKGHLCPASDRKQSYELFKETFFTSNISPQTYDFNAGVWNRLEQKVRYWADKYNGLYIVTAGVLEDNLEEIGKEAVDVPKYFYKVLMTKDQKKMIAFLVPHKKSSEPLYKFVVSVNEIEKKTGIDFFHEMDNKKEENLEQNKDYKVWSFN